MHVGLVLIEAMASRRAKFNFTETEKQKLVKAYDGGMDSVSKEKVPAIEQMARLLNKEEKIIKVYRYSHEYRIQLLLGLTGPRI